MHGGRAGAPKGERNGAFRHGLETNEAIEVRREVAALNRAWRCLRARLGDGDT